MAELSREASKQLGIKGQSVFLLKTIYVYKMIVGYYFLCVSACHCLSLAVIEYP